MSRNFDKTVPVRLQSEKRVEWIREIRKKDCKGLQRVKVALPVWLAHQLRRFPEETSVPGPIVA